MRTLYATWLIAGVAWAAPPQRKTCTPHQAEAADAMVDHLTDWAQVEVAFRKFAQCDDGSIAEGNSEAVVRRPSRGGAPPVPQ